VGVKRFSIMRKIELGLLPEFVFAASIGVLLLALAYAMGRFSIEGGVAIYWIGVIVIYVPIAYRLCMPFDGRAERLGLVIILGVFLLLVRMLYTSFDIQFGDELRHLGTTKDIVTTEHLFTYNPGLSVKPFYPGLHILTTALVKITGLSIRQAGIAIMILSRFILTTGMFLFIEQISNSARVAGVASAIYMANAHFQSFGAMYIYQSLDVPLMMVTFFVAVCGEQQQHRLGYRLWSVVSFLAIIITHHTTSYVLTIWLLGWAFAHFTQRFRQRGVAFPIGAAIFCFAAIFLWITIVTPNTVDYFSSPANKLASSIKDNVSSSKTTNLPDTPLIQRLISMGSVGVIVLCLPPSAWFVWRRYSRHALSLVMIPLGLAYYLTLGIRFLASDGAEMATRSWVFVFFGVGYVIAVGIFELATILDQRLVLYGLAPLIVLMIYLGGLMSGWPPVWGRLPGPYIVTTAERSIEPHGIIAAKWADAHLVPRQNTVSNSSNNNLMASYAAQFPTEGMSWIIFQSDIGKNEIEAIREKDTRYFILDYRLTELLPVDGYYFEFGEPGAFHHTEPLDPAMFAKFDRVDGMNRVMDSGDIVIYDTFNYLDKS
jgi:hypothetical protein